MNKRFKKVIRVFFGVLAAIAVSQYLKFYGLDYFCLYSSRGNWARELSNAKIVLAANQSPYDPFVRFPQLLTATPAAAKLGHYDEAQAYATELLKLAPDFPRESGEAIYEGHIALGRVALARGDRETARRELLTAGSTSGSPVLDSFGPDMIFAREMLRAGERDDVLQYFDLCLRFWKFGDEPIRRWKWLIQHHLPPNFGLNLR
jgi:hypothetical protein